MRAALTSLEVAFAVVVLVGAGLLGRSFAQLTSADLGIRPSGVTIAQLLLSGPAYRSQGAKARAADQVLNALRAIPGVTAVGGSTSMPPDRTQEINSFAVVGQPAPAPGHEPSAIYIPTTAGYFEALRIRLLRGRSFNAHDDETSPPTVVISHELARRYFADVDPVGHEITTSGVRRTIVGVVGDAVYEGAAVPIKPTVYVPYAQDPFPGVWIAVRGGDERTIAPRLRDAIHDLDPNLPVHRPRPLEAIISASVGRPRFQAWLLGAFGAVALGLASVGIYGVIAYGVTQRRPEFGIRLALGASPAAVVRGVLRSGMTPVALGVGAGLFAALLGSRLVAGLLYGVAPTDPVTFVGVALVIIAAALAAAAIPARRAARIDPLIAIRSE